MEVASLSRQFARWAAPLRYADLPDDVVQKVKALLLHALTGIALGKGHPSANGAIELALAEEPKGNGASLFDRPAKVTRVGAAFANAEQAHAAGLFDSYRMLTHPGPVLIPAAFANAELEGRNGEELIVALAVGYEFVCRLCDEFIPATAARGFRPNPVYSTLGAALTSAKLMGLDENGLVAAIAIATNFASGLNEGMRTGSYELPIHEPQAARNGVFAAVMARAGLIRGAETSLEGEAGFYNAFTGSSKGVLSHSFTGRTQADFASVTDGLGRDYKLLDAIYRIYPTAGFNQGPIELMAELRERHALRVDDVEEVQVAMNWLETLYPSPAFARFPDYQVPRAGETTHFFVAYAAVHGGYPVAGLATVSPGGKPSQDPDVLAFMHRVKLVPEKRKAMFSPSIRVLMKDGTAHEGEYPYERMIWGFDELVGRLHATLPGYPGGREAFDTLVDLVRGTEQWSSVQPVLALMQAGRP